MTILNLINYYGQIKYLCICCFFFTNLQLICMNGAKEKNFINRRGLLNIVLKK